jgi:hypothetical protein
MRDLLSSKIFSRSFLASSSRTEGGVRVVNLQILLSSFKNKCGRAFLVEVDTSGFIIAADLKMRQASVFRPLKVE